MAIEKQLYQQLELLTQCLIHTSPLIIACMTHIPWSTIDYSATFCLAKNQQIMPFHMTAFTLVLYCKLLTVHWMLDAVRPFNPYHTPHNVR